MKEPKPLPDWFIPLVASDPSNRANSTRRTVTRVAVILGVLALAAALPGGLGDTGWAHIALGATALIPLAAITLAIHRMSDGRVESITRRLLRGHVESRQQGTLRSYAAELLLLGGTLSTVDERRFYHRVWLTLLVTFLPPCLAWWQLSWLLGGPGLAELTLGDALVLSPIWLAFVPAAGVLVVLFAEVGQAIGCPLADGICVKGFGHDGECELACRQRSGGLFPKLSDYCYLTKDHDGDHLRLCSKRLDRIRILRRSRLPCALPAGHDDACRSMCATRRCSRVDGHEGEHSMIRSQPAHR